MDPSVLLISWTAVVVSCICDAPAVIVRGGSPAVVVRCDAPAVVVRCVMRIH